MDDRTLQVECPMCDHMVPIDAVRCPNCNAVFSLAGMEELQKVAKEISDPASATKTTVEPTPSRPLTRGEEEKKEKSHLLGMLFRKKK